jgi:RNA recognition motif-containing protein
MIFSIKFLGNFSFVNTRDPEGAKRAREALNGSLLGGMPCRINMATRKIKTPEQMSTSVTPVVPGDLSSLPRNSLNLVDYAAVKDDRGNPATRNLFIAGYGPGTTEDQLRTLVAQYATVISVVLKSTFAFVNTTDRDAAVIARQSLGGTLLNGGPLRINFAKESGRLGTSFGTDGVYGPAGVSAAAASSKHHCY